MADAPPSSPLVTATDQSDNGLDKFTGRAYREDDLELALRLSREEYRLSAENSKATLQHNTPRHSRDRLSNTSSSWGDIDSTILRLNSELVPISHPDGDTLVYIGPPPPERGQTSLAYNRIEQHFQYPHCIRSTSLKELNSPKFDQMIGPKSMRTEKRLRREGVLSRIYPDGIKFYLDLRPPCEDEEAVVLVTDLTCTKGVLDWHKAQQRYSIAPTIVCGKDDSSLIPIPSSPTPLKSSATADLSTATEDAAPRPAAKDFKYTNGMQFSTVNPEAEEEPLNVDDSEEEYSQLRHRAAIEKLVHAIENRNPRLDSAPKVWTYFAVAKFYGCATNERINGWIYQWLSSDPNHNFIQNNPEVSYRIGMGIKCCFLTRDTFSILVGEKALEMVKRETNPSLAAVPTTTVHGRKMELLDDDEHNRIEHAASSLVRRIRTTFEQLVGPEMNWLEEENFEYNKILDMVPETPEETQAIEEAIKLIKGYVRGRIYWILCHSYDSDHSLGLDTCLATARPFNSGLPKNFFSVFNKLNSKERVFTRFFWLALAENHFDKGESNTAMWPFHGNQDEVWSDMASDAFRDGSASLKRVKYDDLKHQIFQLNLIRTRRLNRDLDEIRDIHLRHVLDENTERLQGLGLRRPQQNSHQFGLSSSHMRNINLSELLNSTNDFLDRICLNITTPHHLTHNGDRIPTNLINTLMCLEDDEWKYLPLWAEGNDDGTGGVYIEEDVPNLERGGFKGGKRGMGHVNGSSTFSNASSVTSSSFEDVGSEMLSTVGRASKDATDGTETVKSFSTATSDQGAMEQNELWETVMELKMCAQDHNVRNGENKDEVKGKAVMAEEFNSDDDEELYANDCGGPNKDDYDNKNENLDDDDDDILTVIGEAKLEPASPLEMNDDEITKCFALFSRAAGAAGAAATDQKQLPLLLKKDMDDTAAAAPVAGKFKEEDDDDEDMVLVDMDDM